MRSKINFVSQQYSSMFILKVDFSEAEFVHAARGEDRAEEEETP